jgi:hypothetical protein
MALLASLLENGRDVFGKGDWFGTIGNLGRGGYETAESGDQEYEKLKMLHTRSSFGARLHCQPID